MENLKIQHFKKMLEENPKSRAFAPLTESYRKSGRLEEALEMALKGVDFNPNYHGGRVALARVLTDLKQFEEAKTQLKQVTQNEPENLLALRTLGRVFIQLKDYSEAIKVYTHVTALQPNDKKSERILLELKENKNDLSKTPQQEQPLTHHSHDDLENELAFIDALLSQSKYEKAEAKITMALKSYGGHPDLKQRLNHIKGLFKPNHETEDSPLFTSYSNNIKKIKTLNLMLKKIERKQKNDPNF